MNGSSTAVTCGRSVTERLPLAENRIVLPFIATFAVISLLEPSFATAQNIESLLRGLAFVGIVAVGQALLLITGEFDLSVGATAGLGAVTAAGLMDGLAW